MASLPARAQLAPTGCCSIWASSTTPPPTGKQPKPFADRVVDVHPALQPAFVAYLERKGGTCKPKTVTGMATRLVHFGRFLADLDPGLTSLADLDRQRHIEPYLNSVASAINSKNGEPITTADQARRILAALGLPQRHHRMGMERRTEAAAHIPLRHPASAAGRFLVICPSTPTGVSVRPWLAPSSGWPPTRCCLARACGLRIGELLDLELDCVHEIPGNGAWLKVPLGKLDTERMVPLDDETVALIDRIVATRSEGRPLPHPRTGRPAQFLFTHHGRRLAQQALRLELDRAGEAAGIGHVTPHQLRHTFATAMVNAGVSLQALMALLGHVSAEMSLRYGRLFDTTVRAEYERALELAKARIGPLPNGRSAHPGHGRR